MSTLSDNNRLILPENSDPLDPAGIYGAFANSADSILVPRYASSTARDAANNTGTVAGQLCTIEDASGQCALQLYSGSFWETVEDIVYVVKATTTARASTVTPTDDPQLVATLLANSEYEVTAHLFFDSASSVPNYRTCWSSTGSPTLRTRSALGPDTGTIAIQQMRMTRVAGRPLTDNLIWDGIASSTYGDFNTYVKEVVRLTTVASATLTLQWAQGTSNATSSELLAGSVFEVRRLS